MQIVVLIAATSYLLGSIPFGFVLVRIFYGADIRRSGSGNIGATNVARTSPALGVATLILDALKGFIAVLIARHWIVPSSVSPTLLSAIAALCAIMGHVFPIWLKFRGGKGVATGLGSFVLLAPKAILVMLGLFVAIVLAFRYVSLGSIVVVLVFPWLAWLLDGYRHGLTLGTMFAASILMVAQHRGNIRRLLSGTENRFQLRRG